LAVTSQNSANARWPVKSSTDAGFRQVFLMTSSKTLYLSQLWCRTKECSNTKLSIF